MITIRLTSTSCTLLSDNGSELLSEIFIRTCVDLGLIQRTIRPGHAWSNGKVDALSKTLKYQCFPAIAGNVATWDDAVRLVRTWMLYDNNRRAHTGHAIPGCPLTPGWPSTTRPRAGTSTSSSASA